MLFTQLRIPKLLCKVLVLILLPCRQPTDHLQMGSTNSKGRATLFRIPSCFLLNSKACGCHCYCCCCTSFASIRASQHDNQHMIPQCLLHQLCMVYPMAEHICTAAGAVCPAIWCVWHGCNLLQQYCSGANCTLSVLLSCMFSWPMPVVLVRLWQSTHK